MGPLDAPVPSTWLQAHRGPRPRRFGTFNAAATHLLEEAVLRDIDVVSFDVFDTLIFRRCSPEAVQLAVARDLAIHLGRPPGDSRAILLERDVAYAEAAGRASRSGADSEAHLDDINLAWVQRLLPNDPDRHQTLAARAKISKIRFETLACFANPKALRLLEDLAKRDLKFVFVSDMYLGEAHVSLLLESCNLRKFFAAGYVSGDHAALKSSGRLFRLMLEDQRVSAERVLHVGDSWPADGEGAAKAGIRSLIVVDREPLLKQLRFDSRQLSSTPDWHGVSASMFATAPSSHEQEPVSITLGRNQLGPAFASYTHGLVEYCRSIRADGVFFLSREGLLLNQLYEELASVSDLALPTGRYLCLSRLSAARAAMREFGSREVGMEAGAGKLVPIRRILRLLELEESELLPILKAYGFKDANVEVEASASPSFAKLLADERVQARARAVGAEARRQLVQYLDRCGFMASQRVVLADVGWGGQIHGYLEDALKDIAHPEIHSYFMGADSKSSIRRNSGLRIRADFWDATRHTWAGASAFKCVHIIENACRAPHGTIIGHRDGEPLFQPDDASERKPELAGEPKIAALQAGIREYMFGYARYIAISGANASDTVQYARTALARLVYYPRSEELSVLGSITNVENMGRGEATTLIAASSSIAPHRLLKAARNSLWREGTIARSAGRLPALLFSAVRERNWIRKLPPSEPEDPYRSTIRPVVATEGGTRDDLAPLEIAMRERSLALIAKERPGIPAHRPGASVTASEMFCLRGAHLLSSAILTARFTRTSPSGLLSARKLILRECIPIAYTHLPPALVRLGGIAIMLLWRTTRTIGKALRR